jgi:hypothetical protein
MVSKTNRFPDLLRQPGEGFFGTKILTQKVKWQVSGALLLSRCSGKDAGRRWHGFLQMVSAGRPHHVLIADIPYTSLKSYRIGVVSLGVDGNIGILFHIQGSFRIRVSGFVHCIGILLL